MSSAIDKRLQFSNTDLFRYAQSREQEAQASQLKQASQTGPGGVPRGSHTSDYYRTFNLAGRFDNPGLCFEFPIVHHFFYFLMF